MLTLRVQKHGYIKPYFYTCVSHTFGTIDSITPKRGIIMKTLKQLKRGHSAIVTKINGEGALRRRIMDMGITRGTKVRVQKVAPLGDPIEITVRGYELTIRKSEAENIFVEEQ